MSKKFAENEWEAVKEYKQQWEAMEDDAPKGFQRMERSRPPRAGRSDKANEKRDRRTNRQGKPLW